MIKRQQEETDGNALVSTILFDRESIVLHDQVPLSKIEPLTEKYYEFCGFSTALLDAVGDAIKHIMKIHAYIDKYALPLPKTLFVIITDGLDNASHRFNYVQIQRLIERQKKYYSWEFLFLGANIDAIGEAAKVGIAADRAVNYHSDGAGQKAVFRSLAAPIRALRENRAVNAEWCAEICADNARRKK